MSLEKFLREHAPDFRPAPWAPIEEQVEEAFVSALNAAKEDMIDSDQADVIEEDAREAGRSEMRQEMADEILAILTGVS